MSKYLSDKEYSKAYRVYKDLYKKAKKKGPMYEKELTEFQYKSQITMYLNEHPEASLASGSKKIVNDQTYEYRREDAIRMRTFLSKNQTFMQDKSIRDLDVNEIRKGKYVKDFEQLKEDIKIEYNKLRANLSARDAGKLISTYFFGSP